MSATPITSPVTTRRPAVPHHRGHRLRLSPAAESPSSENLAEVRRWVSRAQGPTAIDLFCGAGGLSLGLQDAGFTVLVGADHDELSTETHAANIPGLTYRGDLSDPSELLEHLDAWGVRGVDLVAGGPPCQPFSRAGSSKIRSLVLTGARSEDDPRARLWQSFVAVVAHVRPKAVLIENVPDMPGWDDGAVLIGFYESLRELGYEVDARVLDAFQYGVPQHRARLFIVGLRSGRRMRWPEPDEVTPTLRDAIGDLPPVPPAQREERVRYFGSPVSPLQRDLRAQNTGESARWVDDHITRDVRPDDAEAFRLLREGQTYEDLPESLRRYRSDIFTDKYKRLAWDQVSRTITAHMAKDGYWYIHPEQHRTLSIREAARVQTFPDWFRFAGEPTHRFRQIGNAVPPRLGSRLGEALRQSLEARPSPGGSGVEQFRDDLLQWHAQHARQYPWRARGLSPWIVLMAEMCLHRTRADQVVPVFEALRRLAPTPNEMVRNREAALRAMRSLGLRWRAEGIIATAEALIQDHGGVVPDSELLLRSLPGVGDYVAQAVLCFGFDRRAVLVDTNTQRITTRLNGRDQTRRWQVRLDLYRLAGATGPDAEFNYGLLDLGALVCRAGASPRCGECPVNRHCAVGSGAPPPPQLTIGDA